MYQNSWSIFCSSREKEYNNQIYAYLWINQPKGIRSIDIAKIAVGQTLKRWIDRDDI